MSEYKLRVKKIEVTPDWLTGMLKGCQHPYETNLPKDAFVFGIEWDYLSNIISILVASKEFDVIPEGGLPPKFDVILRETPESESE